ncbi:MAG: hypothetical protein NC922_04665 [Candidatus Omnitrophica bacterium]|nr:hypothetical protein [Candidatus Omnitrophota bacterium]
MERIVYLISFLLSSSNYIVNFSLPLYLISKFSASPFVLGITGFFGNFAYAMFTYIFYKAKWKLHFPWFIISSLFISFIYFLLTICPSYIFLFLLLFINGIFYSRFWPSIQYFFSSNSENLDRYNLSWSFGVIFGVFISGYILKIKNILPFYIGSFFAFIGFILGIMNFKNFLSIYKNLPEKLLINKKPEIEIKKVFFLNFVNFLSVGGILFLFPKLAINLGYSTPLISNIITCLFITRFFMFYFFSRISPKFSEKILFISYLTISIALILTGLSKIPYFHILSFLLIGTSSAFSFRMGILKIIEKGYSTELNESIIGIGLFTGPLIIGILSQILGVSNGFIYSGILILSIFFLQKYLLK